MCFLINDKAKRPKKARYAYKVLRLQGTTLSSLMYAGIDWNRPGDVVYANRGPTYSERMEWVSPLFGDSRVCKVKHAKHGIYVYTSTPKHIRRTYTVRAYDASPNSRVLLRVRCEPEDWLHTSNNGRIMTFRKVTICEKQPDIEWY